LEGELVPVVYKGNFANDKFTGDGIIYLKNGCTIFGVFQENQLR
jgi:hypothetical protein